MNATTEDPSAPRGARGAGTAPRAHRGSTLDPGAEPAQPGIHRQSPGSVWVTDITYIRTWQGWLYLGVVVDLFARKVVGWSMKPNLAREIVLDALLMAVWRRKPKQRVPVHSIRTRARSTAATTGGASAPPTTWNRA